jgi:2-hydroxy-6-oxonona-2,4-dienedioate hydrolase/4,5:9,10-diseco-3-hydroxy-5,9,17-trioxoandrosta-1(10),2-diene-4-oate hydrolase
MSDFGTQRLGDVRPLLPNIRHEILVLWGIEDRCLPLDTALVYLKGLPNAELLMFQRVGHWIPFERPDDFNRAVIEFLNRGRPARRDA